MNIGFEGDDLKPYIEPRLDLSNEERKREHARTHILYSSYYLTCHGNDAINSTLNCLHCMCVVKCVCTRTLLVYACSYPWM